MFSKYLINFIFKNYTHNPNYNASYLIRNAAVSDPSRNKDNSKEVHICGDNWMDAGK